MCGDRGGCGVSVVEAAGVVVEADAVDTREPGVEVVPGEVAGSGGETGEAVGGVWGLGCMGVVGGLSWSGEFCGVEELAI